MAASGADDEGSSATGLLPKQGGGAKDGVGKGAPPAAAPYSRSVLVSLMLGTALEWYDFSTIAQLDAPLSANFFPPDARPEVKALAFWMVYAVAFVVRPVGAVFFGALGDIAGRKVALVITMLLMGTATCLVGCLPTYEHIGPAAPALLAVLRVCMGLSLGAEYTTAIVYVQEAAPHEHKPLHASLIAAACALGSAVGLAVVMAVRGGTDEGQLMLWGWRVPFLSAFPIVIVALVLRTRMAESQEFAAAHRAGGDKEAAAPAGAKRATAGELLRRVPVAQLMRQRPLGFLADCIYVAWLSSAIYVTYGWLPAALRNRGIMAPIVSLGMCLTSLAAEFVGIVAGGAVAPLVPCLAVAAASAPLVSLFLLGTVAVLGAGSPAAAGVTWAMQNVSLGLCGFVLGLHAACFVFIYALDMRSTGFSLAYNGGTALGGSAPAIVSAIALALEQRAPLASRLAPAIWLCCLSVPAAGAALALLRLAPRVNRCGQSAEPPQPQPQPQRQARRPPS
ncbi:hypothetical protein Rsub_03884 [Raphidocelis subcapitata]|uniref:Major facilitator superfamily (MFS) profile domain-containing protein n=1 Tax=Raphidocelis subcapitata TaxID=307507 RepID=A0A2V0NUL7_9CHLO|nr:hypothetical protein Rsub_03884 [Raphidocelis subcapitata]|eukprot:GBF91029.1 hypothetical protein Rsub_03884 [Raphidocelis subcapitata]